MNLHNLINKFDIASEREAYTIIHETVEKGIYFRGTNLWILIFAIFIACVGLNVNSTAVIIGAMLISPLMGPILGMGYSLATYDFTLFKRAMLNFSFAVGASLLTSTLYFLLSPLNEAHSELLARTQPNIYDVIVALFGGLAGIVALSSKQRGNVIPGVAIATALMPPLCTAGYGLASASWSYFFGAFYLFTINTVFIGAATLITVRVLKYPIWRQADESIRKTANRWVTLIVLVTIIPSIYFGYVLVTRERFTQQAASFIRNETHVDGDYLLKSEIDPVKKHIRLVYGGKMIPEEIKKQIRARALSYRLHGLSLTIQQGFSIESDEQNLQFADVQQGEILRLRGDLSEQLRLKDSIENAHLLGRQLLRELQPLYPEIRYCGIAEQYISYDSVKTVKYASLILGSASPKKTTKDRGRLLQWFRSRMSLDSVKIYLE